MVRRTPGTTPLRSPGAILLISCYELGHQPLGLSVPLAYLERAGFSPAVLDVAVERLDIERARAARLIAISVPMHTALRIGVRVAEQIRAVNATCHIAFFGLYATLNVEYLRAHVADSIVGGAPGVTIEETLVDLVQTLDRQQDESPEQGAAAARHDRLDFIPPSRARLPLLQRYARLEIDDRRIVAAAVETSRGCLHMCRHCPIPPVYGGRFSVVPKSTVLDDIRSVVAAGALHITFADPDFLNGPTHALRVVRAMNAEFPAVTFDFTAKVEHLLKHHALLAEFRERGCLFIVSAFESFSDAVLGILHKGHTRADSLRALALVRSKGIALRPSFVPFTPWTSLADYAELLNIVADLGLIDDIDTVQYSIRLLIPPGSLLLEEATLAPFLSPFEPANFIVPWRHPDRRVDDLQAAVSSFAKAEAGRPRDAGTAFENVRHLAASAAWATIRALYGVAIPRPERKSPRLSEPWFC